MKKSVLVLLLALVCFVTSVVGCSKSAGNPNSPSPITGGGSGGSGTVSTASIANWAVYPPGACSNSVTCDGGQALRPNADGRYDLNPALGYDLQVVFNNPRVAGRTVEFTMTSKFSYPQTLNGRFGQTDPGMSTQVSVKTGFNVTNMAADPVVVFEAVESGTGLNVPTLMKIVVPVGFLR